MKEIIKSPLITEKSTLQNKVGAYVFGVDMFATKTEIKNTVEKHFKVKVVGIRTSIGRGKTKYNKFGKSKAPYHKKAFVKLAPGEKISLFEGA